MLAPSRVGTTEHERRCLDAPEDGPNVGREPDVLELEDRRRGGGEPLRSGQPRDGLGVVRQRRRLVREPLARVGGRPPAPRQLLAIRQVVRTRDARGVVGCPCVSSRRAVEDQRGHALRVRRREESGEGPSFRMAEEDRLFRSDGVEHGAEIVGPHVEVGGLRSVGQARSPLVEQDQAIRRRQPLDHRRRGWELQLDFEARREPQDVDEVDRAVARAPGTRCGRRRRSSRSGSRVPRA